MKLARIRGAIVIQYGFKNFRAIAVDKGGNPAHTGALLNAKYQQLHIIEKLLKEGDLVNLEERLYPNTEKKHDVIIWDGVTYDAYAQKGVAVSCYRDVKEVRGDKVIVRDKPTPVRYNTLYDIANDKKAKFLYVYSVEYGSWRTYLKVRKYKVIEIISIDYGLYIDNLKGLGVIKRLNKSNKDWLQERGYIVRC